MPTISVQSSTQSGVKTTKTFTVDYTQTVHWSAEVRGGNSALPIGDESGYFEITANGSRIVYLETTSPRSNQTLKDSGSFTAQPGVTYAVSAWITCAVTHVQSYGKGSVTYSVDSTAPTVSFSPTSSDWDNNLVSVKVTASDSESGVDTVQYAWSTSTSEPASWTTFSNGSYIRQESSGQWYLHIRAVDKAGNVATVYSGKYKIDTIVPSIDITSHPENTDLGYINYNTITFTGTAADNGGSGLYKVIGNADGSYETGDFDIDISSPSEWSWSNTFPEGYTKVKFGVYDNAGNCYMGKYVEFYVDTIAPTRPGIPHIDSEEGDRTPTVSWNKSNDSGSGVDHYEVRFGATPGGTEFGTAIVDSNSYTKDTPIESPYYYVSVRAIDKAGNASSWAHSERINLKEQIATVKLKYSEGLIELPVYKITPAVSDTRLRINTTKGVGCFALVDLNDSSASPLRVSLGQDVKAIEKKE